MPSASIVSHSGELAGHVDFIFALLSTGNDLVRTLLKSRNPGFEWLLKREAKDSSVHRSVTPARTNQRAQ